MTSWIFVQRAHILSPLYLFISLISVSLLSSPVDAKRPKKSKKPPISQALKGVSWGIGHKKVFSYLEGIIKARFDAKIDRAQDDIHIDRIRANQRKEVKLLRASYVRFTGQRTGYEVSMIQNDFVHNNSETLLKMDEGSRQRFYFFRYDRLWKIMIVYPKSGMDINFTQFVKKIKSKYGRPNKTNWETPYGGSRKMIEAVWEDKETQLVLEDKSSFYGRYVMRFLSVESGKEIQAIHKKKSDRLKDQKNNKKQGEIDIFAKEEDVGNVIDQITGTKHKVNLDRIKEVPAEEVK